MISAKNQKFVAITPPGAIVDGASFTTSTIDTLGFSHLSIIVHFGALDIAMAALKVQESDDSGMSGAVDVTGLVGGTDFTLPPDSVDDKFYCFDINLRGERKRYIDLVATGGNGAAGTYMTAFAVLSCASEVPDTAAERGFEVVVAV